MATERRFQDMLNQYLSNDLLKEEQIKRTYVLNKVEKDDNWKTGSIIVPFKSAGASSIASGQLSASNDIAQDSYIRGSVDNAVEIWGSMLFLQRDLFEHDRVSEQNFLKMLPDQIDEFMDYMKNTVSVNLLNGAHFARLTAASTANDGIITVDRVDRFVLNQKVIVSDGTNTVTGYVSGSQGIDVNAQQVLLVTARGGVTPVNFSATNIAATGKCYNDGFQTSAFTSMRDVLLSAANGGSTNLYGKNKLLAPYMQAINLPGASATATNIVQKAFFGYTETRRLGKGNPTDILVSYRNLAFIMAIVEASKGAYNVVPGSQKANQYGWTEIEIGSVTNQALKFVGIQEMEDDVMMFIDWRGWKFYSNGFFRKRKSPDGIEYFEIRAQTGFQYIVDIALFGELVCTRPSYQGIMYGINIPAEIQVG